MMGSWQASPVTVATKVGHRRVMKTTGETGSVKFSTKYCSSNLMVSRLFIWPIWTVSDFLMVFSNRQWIGLVATVAYITAPIAMRHGLSTNGRKTMFTHSYWCDQRDIKIYVNNLLVQIDTSTTSSYTPSYTNIAIYFISTTYTTTTMHTHTSSSIHFRRSTILSILSISTATSGIAWTAIGDQGTIGLIGGICSIMSSHWNN
jgi:hypothetical protein